MRISPRSVLRLAAAFFAAIALSGGAPERAGAAELAKNLFVERHPLPSS